VHVAERAPRTWALGRRNIELSNDSIASDLRTVRSAFRATRMPRGS
jgi:hypothetical protein